MSDNGRGCVVVGAGLAAATVAQTLRDGGFKHPVTLIGEESERPYERPALSKDYLQGKTPVADLYVHSSDWYGDHQVRGRFGEKVLSIDRGRSEVRLQSGEAVAYDQLVIATGATPRPLSLPGADLAGVHTLRRIQDADALRSALAPGKRWVIIGAGWIGLEAAAAARLAGCEVSVLERGEHTRRVEHADTYCSPRTGDSRRRGRRTRPGTRRNRQRCRRGRRLAIPRRHRYRLPALLLPDSAAGCAGARSIRRRASAAASHSDDQGSKNRGERQAPPRRKPEQRIASHVGCGHMGSPPIVMGVAQRGLSQPAPTGEQSLQHKRLRPQPLPDTSQLAPEVRLPSRQCPSMHKHDGGEPQNAPHVTVGGTGSVLARQTPQQPALTLNTQSASLAHRPPPAAPPRPPPTPPVAPPCPAVPAAPSGPADASPLAPP